MTGPGDSNELPDSIELKSLTETVAQTSASWRHAQQIDEEIATADDPGVDLNQLVSDIAARWPDGVGAVEAVREGRREL